MIVASTSIAAIFFDFDGVLVESEPLHYRCWMEVVRPHGGYTDWAEYNCTLTGHTDREAANTVDVTRNESANYLDSLAASLMQNTDTMNLSRLKQGSSP